MNFDIDKFDVVKFDSILANGLSFGLGKRGEQVCIEAAICQTLNLPHGDDPQCVSNAVRSFKISLNDSNWSSAQARAKGLRNLGLAQLGSKGVVDDKEFSSILGKKVITQLIPVLFRQIFSDNSSCLNAANKCEKEGTSEAAAWAAAWAAAKASGARAAAEAAKAAAWAAWAAAEAAAEAAKAAEAAARERRAAEAAARAAKADGMKNPDAYLLLVAELALDTLRELKSPGIRLLGEEINDDRY